MCYAGMHVIKRLMVNYDSPRNTKIHLLTAEEYTIRQIFLINRLTAVSAAHFDAITHNLDLTG